MFVELVVDLARGAVDAISNNIIASGPRAWSQGLIPISIEPLNDGGRCEGQATSE